MRLSLPLVCLSSGLLVPLWSLPAAAAEIQNPNSKIENRPGPRLILAMQAPLSTVAPALPSPPPEADPETTCAAANTAPVPAQTLTAPPAVSLSSSLLQWGRAERRAELRSKRSQTQFHPLRRILSVPGRVILTPYQHPVEK